MNIYVFWDIRLCSPLKVNLRFEGISRLIFRVEVEAKQEFIMEQAENKNFRNTARLKFYRNWT
jgi:hypothetical protein